MSERYHQDGFQTMIASATAPDTAASLTVNASTAHRIWLEEIFLANVGTPDDQLVIYYVGQVTAPGSATAVTPTLLSDAAGQAARSVFNSNHTVEPTYVNTIAGVGVTTPGDGDLLRVPLNTRASYRWIAAPGGRFIAPATTTDGFGVVGAHASINTEYMVGMTWEE